MLNKFIAYRQLLNKNIKKILLGSGAVLALIVLLFVFIKPSGINGSKVIEINKSYEVVARTEERLRTDGNFKLRITNAEFGDYILVQGKRANPIEGKVFLVINMEVENPYPVALYAFPVDLFRLVREDGSKFAPSVHQGSVQIRPESTKKSNVGFVVFPSEKKFKLEVGDVSDPKETLVITF
ncbi:MAG: hypothetical protein WD187_00945 [Candidatus Woykebacteria bacterium]